MEIHAQFYFPLHRNVETSKFIGDKPQVLNVFWRNERTATRRPDGGKFLLSTSKQTVQNGLCESLPPSGRQKRVLRVC
tara:strand:+ start:172 stop:405 length:234 start_codon:yes stop_codon:yes gene_type:complete